MTDEDARRAGFPNARAMQDEANALEEDELSESWATRGGASPLEMWKRLQDRPSDEPLTIAQAAEALGVADKTVRRRLKEPDRLARLTEPDPPLVWKVGQEWRIKPAALDVLRERPVPAQTPTKRPERRKATPKTPKRSATRWEV